MTLYVYSYYKKKGGFYTQPVLNNFDNEEIVQLSQRAFLMNKGSQEHEEQKECDLYALGTFDDVKGQFILNEKPVFLCSFVEVGEEDGK